MKKIKTILCTAALMALCACGSTTTQPVTPTTSAGTNPTSSATINATTSSAPATSVSTVDNKVHVESVTLDKTNVKMEIGQTLQLNATVLPENSDDKAIIWKTSNAEIATVKNGLVTALANGSVTITAKSMDGGKIATCTIEIGYEFLLNQSINLGSTLTSTTKEVNSIGGTVTASLDIENAKDAESGFIELAKDGSVTTLIKGASSITVNFDGQLEVFYGQIKSDMISAPLTSGTTLVFEKAVNYVSIKAVEATTVSSVSVIFDNNEVNPFTAPADTIKGELPIAINTNFFGGKISYTPMKDLGDSWFVEWKQKDVVYESGNPTLGAAIVNEEGKHAAMVGYKPNTGKGIFGDVNHWSDTTWHELGESFKDDQNNLTLRIEVYNKTTAKFIMSNGENEAYTVVETRMSMKGIAFASENCSATFYDIKTGSLSGDLGLDSGVNFTSIDSADGSYQSLTTVEGKPAIRVDELDGQGWPLQDDKKLNYYQYLVTNNGSSTFTKDFAIEWEIDSFESSIADGNTPAGLAILNSDITEVLASAGLYKKNDQFSARVGTKWLSQPSLDNLGYTNEETDVVTGDMKIRAEVRFVDTGLIVTQSVKNGLKEWNNSYSYNIYTEDKSISLSFNAVYSNVVFSNITIESLETVTEGLNFYSRAIVEPGAPIQKIVNDNGDLNLTVDTSGWNQQLFDKKAEYLLSFDGKTLFKDDFAITYKIKDATSYGDNNTPSGLAMRIKGWTNTTANACYKTRHLVLTGRYAKTEDGTADTWQSEINNVSNIVDSTENNIRVEVRFTETGFDVKNYIVNNQGTVVNEGLTFSVPYDASAGLELGFLNCQLKCTYYDISYEAL